MRYIITKETGWSDVDYAAWAVEYKGWWLFKRKRLRYLGRRATYEEALKLCT